MIGIPASSLLDLCIAIACANFYQFSCHQLRIIRSEQRQEGLGHLIHYQRRDFSCQILPGLQHQFVMDEVHQEGRKLSLYQSGVNALYRKELKTHCHRARLYGFYHTYEDLLAGIAR
jgi:hypothetical protein